MNSFEKIQTQPQPSDADKKFKEYLNRDKNFEELAELGELVEAQEALFQNVYATIQEEYEKLSGLDKRIIDDIFELTKKEEILKESIKNLSSKDSSDFDDLISRRKQELTETQKSLENLKVRVAGLEFQQAQRFLITKQEQERLIDPIENGFSLN